MSKRGRNNSANVDNPPLKRGKQKSAEDVCNLLYFMLFILCYLFYFLFYSVIFCYILLYFVIFYYISLNFILFYILYSIFHILYFSIFYMSLAQNGTLHVMLTLFVNDR